MRKWFRRSICPVPSHPELQSQDFKDVPFPYGIKKILCVGAATIEGEAFAVVTYQTDCQERVTTSWLREGFCIQVDEEYR